MGRPPHLTRRIRSLTMPSMYPNLSDEELAERLRFMAAAREARLVEEEISGIWHVQLKRLDVPGDPEPERGASAFKAESPDLREAREGLLFAAENP